MEKFSVLKATRSDGKPVIGSVNMAFKDYQNKLQYPWSLTLNIALDLKNVTANGLPTQPETDTANNFEDELVKKIKELSGAHYIGHFYNDSFLDVYMYLDKPEKVNDYLQTCIDKRGLTRNFRWEI